jgi:hypothetical protein
MASAQDIKPPLTLEELATLFRLDVDDLPGDTVTDVNWKNDDTGLLWKNQEICRYANEAQNEFCFRQPILDSNTQATITHITISIGAQRYSYDRRILSIRRAKFVDSNGDEHQLQKRTVQWMDLNKPQWDLEANAALAGTPEFYVEDYDHRSFDLFPVPDLAGAIHMTVDRLPFSAMVWTRRHQDEPEVDEQHHLDLLDYMKHLAYLKKDAETEDKKLSADFLDSFTIKVGERPSARLLRVRRQERNYPRRSVGHYF